MTGDKTSVLSPVAVLLYHLLGGGDVDFHPAVLCPTGGGGIGRDWIVPSTADCLKTRGSYTMLFQIINHSFGTLLG